MSDKLQKFLEAFTALQAKYGVKIAGCMNCGEEGVGEFTEVIQTLSAEGFAAELQGLMLHYGISYNGCKVCGSQNTGLAADDSQYLKEFSFYVPGNTIIH